MTEFRAIKSEKISLQIIKQIQLMVKNDHFKVGDKLPPERVLAEEFGVSRPSVREALCALEIAGLIKRKTGDGNYILDVSDNRFNKSLELLDRYSPMELIEVREIVEKEVVRIVARSATQNDIDRITKEFKKMEMAVRKHKSEIEEDINFHLSIAESVKNSLLRKLIKDIIGLMRQSLWKRVMLKDEQWPHDAEENLQLHRRILEAIRDHDELKATKALEDSYRPQERYLYEEVPQYD